MPLARHFLAHALRQYQRPKFLLPDAEDQLLNYPWPGNVRELANIIERVVLLHEDDKIGGDALGIKAISRPGGTVEVNGSGISVDFSQGGVSLAKLERTLIVEALTAAGGNRRRAAEFLDISLETLRYRLEKFGLSSRETKPS